MAIPSVCGSGPERSGMRTTSAQRVLLGMNMFDYESVNPVPENSPDATAVYVTDSEQNCQLALSGGWDIAINCQDFSGIEDLGERRKALSVFHHSPHALIQSHVDLRPVEQICLYDTNVTRFWDRYRHFVDSSTPDKCLYVTTGYYQGWRDNMVSELVYSLIQQRWSHSHDEMAESLERYLRDFTQSGIMVQTQSVASAKFVCWNIKTSAAPYLSIIVSAEFARNMQGNIIYSYLAAKMPKWVGQYYCEDYSGLGMSAHRFAG